MKKNCEYLGCEKEATTTTSATEFDGTATQYYVCADHVGQMDCVAVQGITSEPIS